MRSFISFESAANIDIENMHRGKFCFCVQFESQLKKYSMSCDKRGIDYYSIVRIVLEEINFFYKTLNFFGRPSGEWGSKKIEFLGISFFSFKNGH